MAKPYHNNPAPKNVKVFGGVQKYNPVTKTYSVPQSDKQR